MGLGPWQTCICNSLESNRCIASPNRAASPGIGICFVRSSCCDWQPMKETLIGTAVEVGLLEQKHRGGNTTAVTMIMGGNMLHVGSFCSLAANLLGGRASRPRARNTLSTEASASFRCKSDRCQSKYCNKGDGLGKPNHKTMGILKLL